MNFQKESNISEEQAKDIIAEEIMRRAMGTDPRNIIIGSGLGNLTGDGLRKLVHKTSSKEIHREYEQIRNNPELQKQGLKDMQDVYNQYLAKTGNPIEHILHKKDYYAAATLPDGTDVVYLDPTAPHGAILAHELGHITLNHQPGPLATLQTNPNTKVLHALAPQIGTVSAGAGAGLGLALSKLLGKPNATRNAMIGALGGTAGGTLASSGRTAYEVLGASGLAMDYLPEEYDKVDAQGDLLRAGSTYAMGGPASATVAGLTTTGLMLAAANPKTRAFVKDKIQQVMSKTKPTA